jgi:hypothetical protein
MEPNVIDAVAAGGPYVEIIKSILNLGPIGVVLVMGYFAKAQIDKTLTQYREDMLEQRKMYENNVELVKQYQSLASDLKDVITLNIQAMTRLVDRIDKEVCK